MTHNMQKTTSKRIESTLMLDKSIQLKTDFYYILLLQL